jgi:pSer/pThr/pTyr-binding forkhead associated (FHA) protein
VILKSVMIGSGADCGICIHSDGYVSTRHARIDQHADGSFTLTGLGSMNGTWIRRQGFPSPFKVPLGTTAALSPGDTVRVGRTEIPWMEQPA